MKPQSKAISSGLIDKMTQRIVETVGPERIILFGSHAEGTAGPDSDVDLLIVEREPFGPSRSRRKEFSRLMAALREFVIAKDLLLYSCEEFERWRDSRNHVIARAVSRGKVIYERS
jgi:predicted nucleotidyltransferase